MFLMAACKVLHVLKCTVDDREGLFPPPNRNRRAWRGKNVVLNWTLVAGFWCVTSNVTKSEDASNF